jgi:hypothetical protein
MQRRPRTARKGAVVEHWEKEEFILLTEKALKEEEQDKFVESLMKRDSCIGNLLKNDPREFGEEMERCLFRETLILERLEKERIKVIEEIDKVSKNKKAIKKYTSKFPFPYMPVFFDKLG